MTDKLDELIEEYSKDCIFSNAGQAARDSILKAKQAIIDYVEAEKNIALNDTALQTTLADNYNAQTNLEVLHKVHEKQIEKAKQEATKAIKEVYEKYAKVGDYSEGATSNCEIIGMLEDVIQEHRQAIKKDLGEK